MGSRRLAGGAVSHAGGSCWDGVHAALEKYSSVGTLHGESPHCPLCHIPAHLHLPVIAAASRVRSRLTIVPVQTIRLLRCRSCEW